MNKPVAWIIDEKMMDFDDNFIWNTGDFPDWQVKDWIPLYTHPAELTLTDEDILEEWTCKYSDCYQDTLIDFARAILRKASEK